MEAVALDTTFLIDLQRDRRGRGAASGAEAFLKDDPGRDLSLPAIARGEYLEGFDDPHSDSAMALVSSLQILPVDSVVALEYARQARRLRSEGKMIGANDLWIGCTAKCHRLPILTRNTSEFSRISGLQVISY